MDTLQWYNAYSAVGHCSGYSDVGPWMQCYGTVLCCSGCSAMVK